MKITRRRILQLALASAITSAVLTGCDNKGDAITNAEQADKKADIAAPGIDETKAIAEEGFIYGLPIVMNYAVMYEYAVDKNSGQFKAPFNEIKNEARVFTYKDTAIVTPNSDTPYSFLWMDLRAEPMVISVPAVEKDRYYAVQLEDGNTFNYGYIGSRATGNEAGDYMVVGPRLEGRNALRASRRCSTRPLSSRSRAFALSSSMPEDMPNVVKVQAGYKAQPLSAFLKQPAPPAAPKIDFPKIDKEMVKTELLRIPRLRAAVRACRARGKGNPRQARQHRHRSPARPSTSRTSRWSTRPPSCWHEGRGGQDREIPRDGAKERQRLEDQLVLRRPRVLPRRLAAARRRCEGRHLRQRFRSKPPTR